MALIRSSDVAKGGRMVQMETVCKVREAVSRLDNTRRLIVLETPPAKALFTAKMLIS